MYQQIIEELRLAKQELITLLKDEPSWKANEPRMEELNSKFEQLRASHPKEVAFVKQEKLEQANSDALDAIVNRFKLQQQKPH